MKVDRMRLAHVALPLKKAIKHASHERSSSDNLVVEVVLSDGVTGYGEGVPRSYVTGETIESTFEVLSRFDVGRHMGNVADLVHVVQRLEALVLPETANDPRGMAANAAQCALGLALLDAYCRSLGRPIREVLELAAGSAQLLYPSPQAVRYSGAITAETEKKERVSAWKMRLYGFRQVKVKVGVPGQDDAARMARFRRIMGNSMDLRLDANEAWQPEELLERVAPLLRYLPSVLEQPVPHERVGSLAELLPRLVVPVMLDESLCGYPDAVRAVDEKLTDLFNVRLSKCGGILATLRMMKLARNAGMGVQLGCHPGESGILSAAGRHFASNVKGLRYVEGSYDRHVLADNLVEEDITFSYGGRARPLTGPGLGVTVSREALERLTVRKEEICYE